MINYVIARCGFRLPQWMNQLFLIVKITTLLLIVGCLHISAASLSQTVSIKANKWPIRQVFDAIRQQTDYQVIYSDELINPALKVSLAASKMPLETFLNKVLEPLSLTYQVKENTILIGSAPQTTSPGKTKGSDSRPQQRTISGTVTDEQGNPLEGVTVRIKETNTVVTTNASGRYEIQFRNENNILVLSMVGFEPVE